MTIAAARSPDRRRPRRIAADEAHAWARNLRLGNPYAKSVIGFLCGYVNGDGTCFVGIEQLADDADLSMDTVRKRLAWLEQVGAVTRLPQWIDANGRRNGEGRGKRTSDEIRLMINVDPDEIERRAHGNVGDEFSVSTSDISPSHQQGLNPSQDSVSPTVALCQPSDSGKGLISEPEPEQEDSPLPPKGGEAQHSNEFEEKKWLHAQSWALFEEAYSEPIVRQSIARQVWSALTDDERALATRAAKGYVAYRRSQKKQLTPLGAHIFLRERDAWAKFADLAPAEQKAATPWRFVPEDSAEFRARQVLDVLYGQPPKEARRIEEKGKGWMINGPDPSPELLALARFDPFDQSGWIELWHDNPEHKHQLGAWRERVGELSSKSVDTGEFKEVLGSRFPIKRRFSLVPCEWPPRKDGTLSTTGPPVAA